MTNVQYTDYLSVASTAVDDLYFNANDNTLVIDWDDELYRYSGVTRTEAKQVANGTYGQPFEDPSVGRAAQALKVNKNAGEYLGNYNDVDFERVDERVAAGVPKDLTYATAASTKEYSLGAPVSTPTREYSLQSVASDSGVDDADVASTTVFFTLGDSDQLYEFEADSADVYEAIEELNEFVARLKTTGEVKRVVVEFE